MATSNGNERTPQGMTRQPATAGQPATPLATTPTRSAAPLGRPAPGYGPFGVMRRLMEDLDRTFEIGMGRSGARGVPAWQPQIELFERDGQLVVRADLPGVPRDQVQVRVEDDVLWVSGERREERTDEGEGWFHSERSYGSFQRAIQLPRGVEPEKVEASFRDGVLEVRVPAPTAKPGGHAIPIGGEEEASPADRAATGDASAKARGLS